MTRQTLAERLEALAGDLSLGMRRTPEQAEQDVQDLFEAATLARRLERIDRPEHVLVLSADRWTLEHTLACRESGHMAECEVHERIADWIGEAGKPDLPEGRYYVGEGDLLPDVLTPVGEA